MILSEELPKKINILHDITPLKLFELFFYDYVINFIVKVTKLYAQDKGTKGKLTTTYEIKVYFAMFILILAKFGK